MTEAQASAVLQFRNDEANRIERLGQNLLLTEREFISFGRGRGVAVSGLLDGDPGEFFRRGWLEKDGLNHDGTPLFHPFRLHPLHRILRAEIFSNPVHQSLKRAFNEELIARNFAGWNAIVDLARALEPIYWPRITSHLTFGGDEQSHRAQIEEYRKEALQFVKELDCEEWLNVHASLRREAASLDDNPELYVLLRLSTWDARSKVTGRISGALWFRQMAEVIRRAFEDAYDTQWLEEDRAIGTWLPGGRQRAFGSERPFDDEFRSKPYIAYRFGLLPAAPSGGTWRATRSITRSIRYCPKSIKSGLSWLTSRAQLPREKATQP